MATLSAAARDKLKPGQFAGPDRSYPVLDKAHAGNAKARASQAVAAGRMSEDQEAKIDAKANRVLADGGSKSPRKEAMQAKERSGDIKARAITDKIMAREGR